MTAQDARVYEFRVVGHLDDHWSASFGELIIARHDDGTCTLTGPVADQAELHGILARLRDLAAPLLALRVLDPDRQAARAASSPKQPRTIGHPSA